MKTKQWTWEETSNLSPQQLADHLNHTSAILDKLRSLVEQWRLEALREREDFPDETRKLMRCTHQLHFIVEQLGEVCQASEAVRVMIRLVSLLV